ncbi:hypothetical protein [Hydrogenophaga sp. PAMC20947]|uniref:hypothetical protein n=1 Tax=Hydrogenophaga sp. PAMC20947 TaxID=2565558 RepID=UPI00109E3215|nr:hypothetical protein [Hydrogenophaga sp. PAMC20947]QCB47557.1 hypothetical protein E5678_16905 [Hydrogenophaga sp. PAMC20947]
MRFAGTGLVSVCFALGAAGLAGAAGAATAAKPSARSAEAPAAAPSPPADAPPAPRPATAEKPPTDRVLLVCEAAYLPARSVWKRTVEIGYDQKRVRSVVVDGVPVYSFSVSGTVILTSLDNERIQIDTATQTWTSDFRGLATSQGHCERGA